MRSSLALYGILLACAVELLPAHRPVPRHPEPDGAAFAASCGPVDDPPSTWGLWSAPGGLLLCEDFRVSSYEPASVRQRGCGDRVLDGYLTAPRRPASESPPVGQRASADPRFALSHCAANSWALRDRERLILGYAIRIHGCFACERWTVYADAPDRGAELWQANRLNVCFEYETPAD